MKKLISLLILFSSLGCAKTLEEQVYSQLGPNNFYKTAEDAEALLTAVYANSQGYRDLVRDLLLFNEATTDIFIERQGAINTLMQPVEDFVWDATHQWLEGLWGRYYSAIFRANTVIDKVPTIEMDENRKIQILAEARFLRALNYFNLYDLFGAVPLITSSNTTPQDRPSRPATADYIKFIEDEFIAVSSALPATRPDFPKATRGAALGFLTKMYLNNKKWTEAAATAKIIIDEGNYTLFKGANRTQLFEIANKMHNEFIFSVPFKVIGSTGNTYLSHAAPPNYKFKYPPKVNFAAQFKIRSAFANTFEESDQRRDAFLFEYVNQAGNTIVLGEDDIRSFKYPEDPDGVGDVSNNDFPMLRYADILLSRAEALNEISGPTQETIDLINEVREAAGLAELNLPDFSSAETLREHILMERGWEFHTEALRRQDLIRHGKFIQWAKDRGKPAEEYMTLYPIPQREISANQNLEQNPGYK